MKYALCGLLLLAGCSTDLSEQYVNSARSDLTTIEGILSDLDKNMPTECKNALQADLIEINDKIKVIDEKMASSVGACKLEKDVLKSGITKRNWIIGFLVLILAVWCLFGLKRHI